MSNQQQYYQVGGTLKPEDPSYIERQADKNLYEGLQAGKFCYVFNSRQMGKSSLQVRVSKRLANEGFRCVLISLESFGARGVTQEQWYYTFIQDLADKLDLPNERLETWLYESKSLTHVKRFSEFFEKILFLENYQNIVIFLDEIDTVLSLDFPTNDFFAFIRYCYNQRAINPNFKRITFSLLGVATPSQLIQDNQRTPFNIGEAIQLKGFSFDEARTLAQGLESKVSDSQIAEAIIQEILNWTDGQPFLTQKICQIIVNDEEIIPIEKRLISKYVEELVISRIITNWEEQDNPQHLRTIRDRIINSKESTFKLLKLYQKIRQNQELLADDTPEQSELILSGLVLENNRKLKIYNRIYKFVFDSQWVSELLADKRPYEEELLGWLSSGQNKSWLLQGQKLRTAMEWCAGKNLTIEDYQFINASEELAIKNYRWRFIWGIPASLLIIGSGFFVWHDWQRINAQIVQIQQNISPPYVLDPELFSQGERTFRIGDGVVSSEDAITTFKNKNYSEAINQFEKLKNIERGNPEFEIYYNNALAHKKGNYLSLAAVVPVDARKENVKEILRGVAQAQANFNNKGGLKGRLLNIVIANDSNNQIRAQKVAQELVKDQNVLGVIGHNNSEATRAALYKYEKARLPMISPTSTSTLLRHQQSKVFFRTVTSDQASGEKLADYAIKNNIKRVVIYNRYQDIYSESLTNAFATFFIKQGGKVLRTKNLADPKLDARYEVYLSAIEYKADAAIFFPNTELTYKAIEIARAQQLSNFPRKLKMLGGDSLYSSQILKIGQKAIEGLILAIPWYNDKSSNSQQSQFVGEARKRWEEDRISWETATSYDATQAFIKAMSSSDNPSRQSVLEKLPSINLSPDESSGDGLQFINGEREQEAVLVKVVNGDFVKVDEN
ncbi:ABC transporter substrate-binding protein [Scytonema hofmannii FACHB-248]|uniref:ABC transporter substrate-binding protein n=1 Tax=Scytonema hofmannii FACHB-248 TaxID=1842502 RepID=A0ABR8GZB1_9CYAN|nr:MULTISPECIES: ABC transporter substrate-binding protein [Nostocales]MBD2608425.1 ABC transporter substrate-binding protein [Scytonema hofmannii FACHB-248]